MSPNETHRGKGHKRTGAEPTIKVPETVTRFSGILHPYVNDGHPSWAFQDMRSINSLGLAFTIRGDQIVRDITNITRTGSTKRAQVLRAGRWVSLPESRHWETTQFSKDVSPNEFTRVIVAWADGIGEEARLSTSLLAEGSGYNGLHILENGNKLTIFDRKDRQRIIWQGVIDLVNIPGSVFPGQNGVDFRQWRQWFLAHYPAKLETKVEKLK